MRRNLLIAYLVALGLSVFLPAVSGAPKRSSGGRQTIPCGWKDPYVGAIVVDASTRAVLHEDNADRTGYPASVVKLMGLLIVLEEIELGTIKPDDKVRVTAEAAGTGGSQVYLKENEMFTVDELLYALVVSSANDAAVALAMHVAGTKSAFIEFMNKRAREIGMTSTRFCSVHGLPPSEGQQPDISTARDIATLSCELLKHPSALRYTSTERRNFREGTRATIAMETHNPLLGKVQGCDGLKTGWFRLAGYSIAATACRNNRRVVAVVLGSRDRLTRNGKVGELLARGFLTPLPAQNAPTSAVVAAQAPSNTAEATASDVPKPAGEHRNLVWPVCGLVVAAVVVVSAVRRAVMRRRVPF